MTASTIAAILREREAGNLDRDAYWRALQKHHASLSDYVELLDRAGQHSIEITRSGLVLHHEDGPLFQWDPSDLRSPPVVLINEGEYEPTEWAVVQAFGRATATVVDIGANIGWYPIRLAAGSHGRIHAFEPIPRTFEIMRGNIALNGFEQEIRAYPYGLSDGARRVRFFVPDETGSVAASERRLFDDERQSETEVELRALDDVVASEGIGRVDFIKCDVEGGEFGVLKGAEAVLRDDRPVVLLEMLRKWARRFGYHPNDIIEWMDQRGFRCASVSGREVRSIAAVDDDTAATNFLFIHETRVATAAGALAASAVDVHLD